MDWFVGSALIFGAILCLFTYSVYKFQQHQLKHKKPKKPG
jgi:hypothetical protein